MEDADLVVAPRTSGLASSATHAQPPRWNSFPQWGFTVYFVAPVDPATIPTSPEEQWGFCMRTPGCIELTHNYGSEKEEGKARSFDVSFTVLSPSMAELPRKGVIRALQPPGSDDVLLFTASSSASRWAKTNAESEARSAAASFRVTATKPTPLKREASADYRFGQTSGPSSMKSRNDGF